MSVCVEVLLPSQPYGVMSSAVSLPNHTFTKRLTSIVNILSPETDNCPSWISGRERMTVENIHDQTPWKNIADLGGGRTRDLLVSSRTRIHLSHRGRRVYHEPTSLINHSDFICFTRFHFFFHWLSNESLSDPNMFSFAHHLNLEWGFGVSRTVLDLAPITAIPGGGTYSLVPLKKMDIVSCSSKSKFSMFPVPQKCLSSPVPSSLRDFCSLFPWNKWPYSPVPKNPLEGLAFLARWLLCCSFFIRPCECSLRGIFRVYPFTRLMSYCYTTDCMFHM